MNLKKTLSLILALIMIAATFGVIAIPAAAEGDAVEGGEGGAATETVAPDTSWYTENPDATTFTIYDANDLDGLAKLVNEGTCNFEGKTVKLGADIVYNSGIFSVAADGSALYNGQPVSETNMPREYTVIGNVIASDPSPTDRNIDFGNKDNKAKIFHGNFDGCGHSISGLYVHKDSDAYVGLFSCFAGEELKNTSILNSYLRGEIHIASFVGVLDNDEAHDVKLEYLYSNAYLVSATESGSPYLGGLVAFTVDILAFTVDRCAYEGTLTVPSTGNSYFRPQGGLIAWHTQTNQMNRPAKISNCYVNVTFFSNGGTDKMQTYRGGIIGNSRATGGEGSGVTIENCLTIIDTAGEADSEGTKGYGGCGPFVGFIELKSNFEIKNSYCIIKSKALAEVTTIISVANSKVTIEGIETVTEGKTYINAYGEDKKIENPAEATGLPSDIFVLTETSAAIKDLNACFDGHSFTELYQAKEASCEGEGWSAHYRCNNCSKFFDTTTNEVDKSIVIIPASHNYGEIITGTPATCTENGMMDHYKCSLCNRMFNADKDEVNDLTILAGHTYGELVRRVKATCTEPGTIAHYQCSACEKYFDEDKAEVADITIPAAGHDYGDWNEAVAPTTSAAGVLGHYKCGECRKYFDADKNELASIEGEPKLTTTKKPDTTKTPTTTVAEEKGCGGFTAVGALLALVALTGAAVVIKKK